MVYSSGDGVWLQHANEDVEKMILGNKCDMEDKRQVSRERGEAVCVTDSVLSACLLACLLVCLFLLSRLCLQQVRQIGEHMLNCPVWASGAVV